MTRLLLQLCLCLLLTAHTARAADPDAQSPSASQPIISTQARADIAAYAGMAHRALEDGDEDLADKFYKRMLDVPAPDSEKKAPLIEMFESYRSRAIYSKAIAVGERIRELYPNDPEVVSILLELGQVYRTTGAFELAIERFYNVLNAALRIDPGEYGKYQLLSTKAQFEIAQTFLDSGDYMQAARSYGMLCKLDIPRVDRAKAEYQLAYCRLLTGDFAAAEKDARRFLEAYSDTPEAPQGHYVLSMALNAQHRLQEATDETLTLLRIEKNNAGSNDADWKYWQKKTGNQLANGFYQQGDYFNALTLYQALARLGNEPDWLWPVIYQIGLCLERLRLPDRAIEAYRYIVNEKKKNDTAGAALTPSLDQLAQMAQWRIEHLTWQQQTETELTQIIGQTTPGDPDPLARITTAAGQPQPAASGPRTP